MAPKYIEEKAHYYLKKVISLSSDSWSTDEFLDVLKDLKKSLIRHNKDVFSCVISKLLDERTYSPQYSHSILMKYANVFGGIIEYDLISNPKTLSNALRFVFDALNGRPHSKMFDFGIIALNRFHECLRDPEQYFKRIAAIPHFQKFPLHLIEWIEDYVKYNTPKHVKTIDSQKSSVLRSRTTTPAVDTRSADLLEEYDFGPVDRVLGVKEKIAFIINNLSADNLNEKCDEIKGILRGEHFGWLSKYLIEQRVCFEFNLHALYSRMLDRIANEHLNALVLSTTVENIQVLLDSETTNSRAVLKNLGHWLGIITLGKNKPIPFHHGFLNSLLTKACGKGCEGLMSTVPFVAKILLSCAKSQVYGPRSPWTLCILRNLAELHKLPGLKLNIQFEIEVLCKSLNIELGDLKSRRI